jgi:phosphoribosylglycinamide formyltransferase-1
MRFVIVASTGGAVMNELLKNEFFKSQIYSVVSDRECPAIAKANNHSVRTDIIAEKDRAIFCARLLNYLHEHEADYAISFFSKLYVGDLLKEYEDRIINLHPSILPSFKGLDGFGDTVRYGARYVGSTIHFIDEKMDEGKMILQTIYPVDERMPLALLRHRIFEQQCRSLLQVVKWLVEGRMTVKGKQVVIENAKYDDLEFSPNLDFVEALNLRIPYPKTLDDLGKV